MGSLSRLVDRLSFEPPLSNVVLPLTHAAHDPNGGISFIRLLLNAKFDMLDLDIPKRLPQHPVASALGIKPTRRRLPQR